jgi:hypothetical protein
MNPRRNEKMTKWILTCAMIFGTGALGCEEEKKPEAAPVVQPVAPLPAEKTAEEKAAEEQAAAEAAKKAEEAAKAEAELQENPLTECCRALAQQAFMQRSVEFKAGEQICGEAMKEDKKLSDVLPAIQAKLAGKTLPEPCTK